MTAAPPSPLTLSGRAYVTGFTLFSDFPTTPGAFRTQPSANVPPRDAFVTKLDLLPTGYPRPKAATPFEVPLVPAYIPCTSPNRTHGPPLASGSCNPAVTVSDEADAWHP